MEEAMKLRRLLPEPNSVLVAILPNELIVEILTLLPVKPLIRFKCINKFFKTLISDPYFVQMHLNKSSRNWQLALTYYNYQSLSSSLVTLSFHDDDDPYYQLNDYSQNIMGRRVIASCNGLLLIGLTSIISWLYIWNPATRTKSEKISIPSDFSIGLQCFEKFSFGYDNSTRTYKVVAFYVEMGKYGCNPKSMVNVFSMADNYSRNIQCLPALPLYWSDPSKNNGVHLNGTINWLAFRDYINSSVTVDQYVILSLDLSTETYTQLLPPPGFDKLPQYHQPKIVVLMDCLCFCHYFEKTHFVIWQMKDFGVQDSWIQLFKISFENFFKRVNFLPLYLSENGDRLILANDEDKEAFIYNHRDKTVEKIGIGISNNMLWWSQAKDYVESLVSTH